MAEDLGWGDWATPPPPGSGSCATTGCLNPKCPVCSVPVRFKGMQPKEQEEAKRLAKLMKQGQRKAPSRKR